MSKTIRASVIIPRGNKILVAKSRYSSGRETYLLPGGKVEDFEAVENAAIREVKEETDLDIQILKLVKVTDYIDKTKDKDVLEVIYLGKIKSRNKETHLNDPSKRGHVVGLTWMGYEELREKEFYPKEVLDFIKDILL